MTEPEQSPPMAALRRFARRLPGVEEGSCVNRAFRAGGKAFAYLGAKPDGFTLRLRLGPSLAQADALHAKHPHQFEPGKAGWTLVRWPHDETPPRGLLEGWIEESYRLLAPRALVAQLGDRPAPRAAARQTR